MKILVSSKQLSTQLNKINFENETVVQVRGERGQFIINTDKQTIEMWVEMLIFDPIIKQKNIRWDLVKRLVNKVEEHPIVLDINERVVTVMFQY